MRHASDCQRRGLRKAFFAACGIREDAPDCTGSSLNPLSVICALAAESREKEFIECVWGIGIKLSPDAFSTLF